VACLTWSQILVATLTAATTRGTATTTIATSNGAHVASFATLGAIRLFERDLLTLGQRLETVTLDAREVDEEIVALGVSRETKALGVVEEAHNGLTSTGASATAIEGGARSTLGALGTRTTLVEIANGPISDVAGIPTVGASRSVEVTAWRTLGEVSLRALTERALGAGSPLGEVSLRAVTEGALGTRSSLGELTTRTVIVAALETTRTALAEVTAGA